MNTYYYVIDFIDAFTGETRQFEKAYRAVSRDHADKGIADYMETNKTIRETISIEFVCVM